MNRKGQLAWVVVILVALFIFDRLGNGGGTPAPEPKPIAIQRGPTTGDADDVESITPKPVVAATPTDDGMKHITAGKHLGCPDRETYSRLVEFAIQKDADAFASLFVAGGCTDLPEGEVVYLDEVGGISGAVKIRRKGEVNGLWTAIEAVE